MDSAPIFDESLAEGMTRQVDLVKDLGFSSRVIYQAINQSLLLIREDDSSMTPSPRDKSIDIEAAQ